MWGPTHHTISGAQIQPGGLGSHAASADLDIHAHPCNATMPLTNTCVSDDTGLEPYIGTAHRPSVTTRQAPLVRARAMTARALVGGTSAPASPRTTRSNSSRRIAAASIAVSLGEEISAHFPKSAPHFGGGQ